MVALSQVLTSRRLPALDGLRAVAVAVVVLYHGGLDSVPGDLGVTLFFVLSGFLITWLLLKERDRTGGVDLRAFYLRRSLRIFPAYFALVVLSLAADRVLGSVWEPGRIWAAMTYTLNYHNAFFGHEGPVAHGWSLAVEEQFYILWPALFLWLVTRDRLRDGLVSLIGVVLVWRAGLYLAGAPPHYVYNAFDTRFDSLAIGCLLATLCRSGEFLRASERLAARAWYPLPVVALLYVIRTQVPAGLHYTVGFSLEALLMAVLIVQALQLASSPGWRWLNHPLIVWLGALSYPLYLWHGWGITVGLRAPGGPVVEFAAGIALSILIAAGSYYGLERYFLRMKERTGTQTAPAPEQTASPLEQATT